MIFSATIIFISEKVMGGEGGEEEEEGKGVLRLIQWQEKNKIVSRFAPSPYQDGSNLRELQYHSNSNKVTQKTKNMPKVLTE